MTRRFSEDGQALLLVIWAMFIMSFSILGLMRLLNVDIGTSTALERVAIASSLAFAGVTMGKNSGFPADAKAMTQSFPNGTRLELLVVSENGRLNINRILANQDRETLRALFKLWNLNDTEADTVVDCLLDYVEPGTVRRLNGAKAEQYRMAGRPVPPGRPFRSVDEMTSVLNFGLVTKRKDNWRDYFTIYGDGTLDLVSAPADLIKVVCKVGDASARALATGRAGEIPDIDAARRAMGLTEKEFQQLAGRVSIGSKVRRVRSHATMGQASRTIEAVVRMEPSPAILNWREW